MSNDIEVLVTVAEPPVITTEIVVGPPGPAGPPGSGGGSALTVKDEGTSLSTAVTSLDFVGAGVTATGTTAVTVNVPSGGGAPSGAAGGSLTGTYPNPTLSNANLTAISGLSTTNNLITKWTGAGTASTVDITTDWLTQYPLQTGRGSTQTIIGAASGATGTLVLQGSADSTTAGAISLRAPVRLRDIANETITTADPGPLLRIRQTKTLDFALASFGGGGIAASAGLISFEATVQWNQTSANFGSTFVKNTGTYKNVSTVAANIGAVSTISSNWVLTADAASITVAALADFFSNPTLNTSGGGALSCPTDFVNFEGTATISSGVTCTQYRAFVAKAPTVTGTLTTYKGLYVEALSTAANAIGIEIRSMATAGVNVGLDILAPTGGTTNIGLRNAGTSVDVPTTGTITAVGNTIPHTSTRVYLNNTSGSSKTLTSAPTISDGTDGEVLTLVNVGTSDVVIQDQGTLASSNLRLGATTRTLSTRDSIRLAYNATIGDWVEDGFTNVL